MVERGMFVMSKKNKSDSAIFPYEVSDIIKMSDIYTIINYIQTTRESCSFIVESLDSPTMEHVFTDVGIIVEKENHEFGVKYSCHPAKQVDHAEEQIIFDDDFPDEMMEQGQCF